MEHADLTEKIIGTFYDVYNKLGYGFLESVYKNSMLIALKKAGLQGEVEWPIKVHFDGEIVGEFRADIVAENKIILELKSSKTIDDAHVAQTLNYLKATEINVGLLLNFGPKPEFKRLFLIGNHPYHSSNPRPKNGYNRACISESVGVGGAA